MSGLSFTVKSLACRWQCAEGTVLWWAWSPRTFAIGVEVLQDGLIAFAGPVHFGWGSLSGAIRRAQEPCRTCGHVPSPKANEDCTR